MNYQEKEDSFIKELSGGQKKRASIAVELLSDPNLFFLDEPSSGLDPGTERNLMKMLYNTSRKGKTVILVTHNTLNLNLCDKIAFLSSGGNLCFYGSPNDALSFFGASDLVDIYNILSEQASHWKECYNNSKYASLPQISLSKKVNIKKERENKQSIVRQIDILSKRYIKLLLNDKQRILLLLMQAPLLILLISFVADGKQFIEYEKTKSILFAFSCCTFWIGIMNSIQEVCKERIILKREHMTGLKISAYISSKFIVLGMMCLIHSLILTSTFTLLIGASKFGNPIIVFIKMYITTFLTAYSAAGIGLFVSCIFSNTDRVMTMAPILLMPQILFSGLVFKLSGLSQMISIFVNCRWAMESYGTIANLNALSLKMQNEYPMLEHEVEAFFTYSRIHLISTWSILLSFTFISALLCGIVLRNIDK